jgi:FkbM family methyltransferase
MLISVKDLHEFWRVRPTGVVHVGAHAAEEQDDYEKFGFGPVVWVEAQPLLVEQLRTRIKPPSKVVQALIWDKSGEDMPLKITNNSQSSSVFELGTHEIDYPDVKVVSEVMLKTVRLDEIIPDDSSFNFLNLDIQGAEYQALKSLGNRLDEFDYIYLEVNGGQVYKGIKQVEDIDRFLGEEGFSRVATFWTEAFWGDAFYIRKKLADTLFRGRFGIVAMTLVYKLLLSWRKSTLIRRLRDFLVFRKTN